MAQHLFEPFIRLGHLGELAKIGADMPFEPVIVIDAGRGIIVPTDEFLQLARECRLIADALRSLERAASPFLGGGLVVIVAGLIAAPVRRLIQPRYLEPALEPLANLFGIPWFRPSRHRSPNLPT